MKRVAGGRDRLVKKEVVLDLKSSGISLSRHMAQSDMYMRSMNRDSKFIQEETELLLPKREPHKKGVVKQKPFSIYNPSQKNEMFKLH